MTFDELMEQLDNQNPFDILGVRQSIPSKELKEVYLRLVLKYHAVENQDDDQALQAFKQIGIAYELLSNRDYRQLYMEIKLTQEAKGAQNFTDADKLILLNKIQESPSTVLARWHLQTFSLEQRNALLSCTPAVVNEAIARDLISDSQWLTQSLPETKLQALMQLQEVEQDERKALLHLIQHHPNCLGIADVRFFIRQYYQKHWNDVQNQQQRWLADYWFDSLIAELSPAELDRYFNRFLTILTRHLKNTEILYPSHLKMRTTQISMSENYH